MGKTAFCASLAARLPTLNHRLLGINFFPMHDRSTSEPQVLVRNLAFQIADRFPELQPIIMGEIESIEPLEDCQLDVLCRRLIIEPLDKLRTEDLPVAKKEGEKNNMLIVLDGLDMCDYEVGGIEYCGFRYRHELLDLVAMLLQNLPPWVKILIASRPDSALGDRMEHFKPFVLAEDDSRLVGDVDAFAKNELGVLYPDMSTDTEREVSEVASWLVEKSGGNFFYFTMLAGRLRTVLGRRDYDAGEAMSALKRCALGGGVSGMLTTFFGDLRAKYIAKFDPVRMLNDSFFHSHCMKLLNVVIFSLGPLHRSSVERIVGISVADMDYLCEELHFLFSLRQNSFIVLHQTVCDWLQDASTNPLFVVDRRKGNLILANSMLFDFKNSFKHEVENSPGSAAAVLHSPLRTRRYALQFLVDHCDMITILVDTTACQVPFCSRKHDSEVEGCWNPSISMGLFCELSYIQEVLNLLGPTKLLAQMYSRCANPHWNLPVDRYALHALWTCLRLCKPGVVRGNDGDLCTQLLARLHAWGGCHPSLKSLLVQASAWLDSRPGIRFMNPVVLAPSINKECKLRGHTSVVNTVTLLGYDRLVSACNDKTARIWSLSTMTCIRVLRGHALWVTGACGLEDGRVVTASCDNSVRIWNSVSGESELVLTGHTSDVSAIVSLSPSRVVSGSKDFTLRVWNVWSGCCTYVMKGHESEVTSLCVLSDSRVVSGSKDFTVRVWGTNFTCERVLRGHQSFVTGVCSLPGDVIVSSSHDMTVRVWHDGAPYEKMYLGHMNSVSSVCVVNGQWIVSGSVDMSVPTIRVWNTATNECELAIITEDDHSVSGLCALSDGRVVSCSTNYDISVWDMGRQVYRAMANWQDYMTMSGKAPRQKDFLGLAALSGASTVRVHGLRSSATSTIRINTSVLSRKVNGLPVGDPPPREWSGGSGTTDKISVVSLVGNRLIVGCGENSLRLCDTNSLKQGAVIGGGEHVFELFCVLSTEDAETDEVSEIIVTASPDNTLRFWNPSSGICEGEVNTSTAPQHAVAICAVGKDCVAMLSESFVLAIWNVRTRKQTKDHELDGMTGRVCAMCSYGDGYYYIVTASADATLRIWNAKEGDCEQVLTGHTDCVNSVCVLRGERIVSGSSDKTVRVWNSNGGDCDKVLVGHIGPVAAVCPLWGGRTASGSTDKTIRVWDPVKGSCLQRFDASGDDVLALCELDDGRVASCSSDFILCYWDTVSHLCEFAAADKDKVLRKDDEKPPSKHDVISDCEGHTDAITVLHLLDNGCIVSGSKDCTLRKWSLLSYSCTQVFRGHKGWVAAACGLPDGRLASGAHDNKVRMWNPNGACLRTLRGHSFRVVAVCAFNNILVSGSHDKSVRVWDSASGECRFVLEGHSDWISDIRPTGNGCFVSVSNETVCVWNGSNGELDRAFQGPKSVMRAVCVLSDGRIITGSNDSICGLRFTIHLWDPSMDKIVRVHDEAVEPSMSGLSSLFTLPDQHFMSINNENIVRVWRVLENAIECEKQFLLDSNAHVAESGTMSLLSGQIISKPPAPSYLDGDPCTVAIRTMDTNGACGVLASGTVLGKLHFTSILPVSVL